jgi:hypothetical protein
VSPSPKTPWCICCLAWVVLVVGLLAHSWILAFAAAVVIVYQLGLLIRRVTARRVPRWVREAPGLELIVSNVFIDNKTPAALARVLLERGGDLLVILEWNAAFVREFDAAGARETYPHRVFDAADTSDYAVGVVSKLPLLQSKVLTVGPLKLTQAVAEVGGQPATIVGLNPMATVDPEDSNRGRSRWTP